MNKICSKCNIEKDEDEFYISARLRKKAWCRSCFVVSNMKSYQKHYIQSLLRRAETRAKEKNLEFNLTEEDIIIPDICPVLGIPISKVDNRRGSHNSPSLDRINNNLGYVKNNVMIISDRANRLKKDATVDELRKLSEFYTKLSIETCNEM